MRVIRGALQGAMWTALALVAPAGLASCGDGPGAGVRPRDADHTTVPGEALPTPGIDEPTEADPALRRARDLLSRTPIIDGHNDLMWEIRTYEAAPGDVDAYDLTRQTSGHTDLAGLRSGGVGGQFWSVYTPGEYPDSGYARVQLEQIDLARRVIDKYPDLELARTADEVERAIAAGKIASMLGLEGGHAIENSLGALRAYHALGVRYMTLTHNVTLDWADAAMDSARHGGLTPFGVEVVREMNRLGVLVDLSHASPATMSDALNATEAPVIFSHSSARALTDVPRNVPDSILARMRDNGGVVMVTFVPPFVSPRVAAYDDRLDEEIALRRARGASKEDLRRFEREYMERMPRPTAGVHEIADHVEHVREVAGMDHVGLGSDYDGMRPPAGLEDVSRFPVLFAELIRRGWTDEELGQLASGNILRVMREAEAVAERLQRERRPSMATPAR